MRFDVYFEVNYAVKKLLIKIHIYPGGIHIFRAKKSEQQIGSLCIYEYGCKIFASSLKFYVSTCDSLKFIDFFAF